MRNLKHLFLATAVLLSSSLPTLLPAQQSNMAQATNNSTQSARIAVVNTKRCVEESKLGKQEQANLEKMKGQMEAVLQEKEKTLQDVENKLNDDDYMDSISDEAAAELKRKRKTIRQEGFQLQNQYLQTLQQAQYKIIQKINDTINKASAQVAQESGHIEVVLNDEACPYYNPQLDISSKVIAKMNAMFDAEPKDAQPNNKTR